MTDTTADVWTARVADEPAFGLDHTHALHVARRWPARRAGDYLAHSVVRDPQRLVAHVQRILLWAEAGDADETWGALLDLSICLGTQGADLRRRMLAAAGPALAGDARDFAVAHLDRGCTATQAHPKATCSVLTKAVTGRLDLVATASPPPRDDPSYDVVAQARDDLLAGDLAGARARLEQALAEAPHRADVATELLAIYAHQRDVGRLRETRAALASELPDHAAWDDVERQLGDGGRH